jgi:hypothetical protein
MSDPELQLEKQRAELLKQIGSVGDHCAKPGSAGHGPSYRLTRKVRGKTVTETFSTPAALKKAQREVAEFHQFQ